MVRTVTQEGSAAMIWVLIVVWIAAFAASIVGGAILYQTGMADFEPWEQARRRLILAAILLSVPGGVLGFQFLPIPLAIVMCLVVNALAILQSLMTVPNQWRRVVGKRR